MEYDELVTHQYEFANGAEVFAMEPVLSYLPNPIGSR